MSDVYHNWGDDLVLSPTGDLALASGTTLGQQRVLKRLITGPYDDINHPDYGAGLRRFIGSVVNVRAIKAHIIDNLKREQVVAKDQPPVVVVTATALGAVTADVRYVDAKTGEQTVMSIPITE